MNDEQKHNRLVIGAFIGIVLACLLAMVGFIFYMMERS